jgi:hypothetical protein
MDYIQRLSSKYGLKNVFFYHFTFDNLNRISKEQLIVLF